MYVNFSISEQRLIALQRELGRAPDQRNPSRRVFRVYEADGKEVEAQASLNFVDAAVDARTDTLPLRLVIPNPKLLLRAGEYVKVSVQTAERANTLVIPQRAVQELQDKRFVWAVVNGKAESRDVVMGARIGTDWLVESGLTVGDVVVIDGVQKLKPGSAVQIDQPGEPSPPVKKTP
jgi:membrane fusion protein (multidrug efflux system)